MKIKLDVDCTPEELRRFFGLPDMTPLHDDMLSEMRRRMKEGLSQDEMAELMRNWMGGAASGMEQFQKFFLDSLAGRSKK